MTSRTPHTKPEPSHGDSAPSTGSVSAAGSVRPGLSAPPPRRTSRKRLGNGWTTVHESNPETYPAAANAQETNEVVHVFKLGDLAYWIAQANKQAREWFVVSGPRKDEISGKVKRTFILFVKGGLHADLNK